MKHTLWVFLALLAVVLFCGAALADGAPWSGAGTESNPWKITSAADLVALRDYIAATEGATQGKYFLQTADISLSSVCGASIGDFMIGVREGNSYDTHVFDGTYDGGGHAITDLYIGNGGNNAGLFAELEAHGKIMNLNVTGYVKGAYEVGGIVAHLSHNSTIENCQFIGTVTGTDTRVGGIAGAANADSSIKNCSVDGKISGVKEVGGIAGSLNGNANNCNFSGIVNGTVEDVGGISGYAGGTITDCTVDGEITGTADAVGGITGNARKTITGCQFTGTVTCTSKGYCGGIVGYGFSKVSISGCSFNGNVTGKGHFTGGIAGYTHDLSSISDCTAQGAVKGGNGVGGIIGQGLCSITNCKNYASVTGDGNVAGIAGCCASLIKNCENHGDIYAYSAYAAGITGHTYSAKGLEGSIEDCTNYAYVRTTGYEAGGIVVQADYGVVQNCTNYGKVEASARSAAGIVVRTKVRVKNCKNFGEIVAPEYTASILLETSIKTPYLTINANGANGEDREFQVLSSPYPAPDPGCFSRTEGVFSSVSYEFYAWNTEPDGSGTYYFWKMEPDENGIYQFAGDEIPVERDMTLYAIWMMSSDGRNKGSEDNPWLLDDGLFGADGGWYTTRTSLTFAKRFQVKGDVHLIIPAGVTVTASKGISVPAGSSLTISGPGTLVAAADENDAGIGGSGADGKRDCGTVIIQGGTVTATGGSHGAGIGGGMNGKGGSVTVNGGAVTIQGGYGAAGVGGGDYGSGGAFTLNSGTVTATGGDYGAGIGGGDEGSGGTIVINGGSLTARGTEGAAGIGGGDYGNGGNVRIEGGTVRAYGSTRSKTGQAAAGIGAGRPKADGSSPRYRGIFIFVDGDLLAAAGTPSGSGLGAQALGVNLADADESMNERYSTELLLCTMFYRITAGDSESAATLREIREFGTSHARELACALMPFVHIEECHDHVFDENNGCCIYCGMNAAGGTAAGTADDPVLIRNDENWNQLAAMMADGYDSTGKYFRLTGNISVNVMLGTPENPFKGHFDGAGHTLTVNLGDAGLCAPFRGISSAEIVNLKVAGSVKGANHSAGLAAAAFGTNLIENCVVSAGVTTTGTHCGGFIGHAGTSDTTIRGCVFSGTLNGASHAGTFWGWSDSGASPHIQDCLDISGSNFPIGVGSPDGGSCVINTYYMNPNKITGASRPWSYGGDLARSVTAGEGVTVDFGEGTSYSVSGLTAYAAGLTYGGVFCAGEDQLVAITISCSLEEPEPGYTRVYTASSGTLSVITDSLISLIVGSEDCVITAGNLSAFQGRGTQDDPFLISAAEDWAALGEQVENGFDTAGKYFLLTRSISVNTSLGSYLNRFKGDFDGGGNTLVVALRATGTDPAAPFGGVSGATIRNLAVQGSVFGGNYTAGLAAYADGVNLIENCAINVLVQTTSRSGGVIGNGNGSVTTIMGCVFSGALNESSDSAVFWGWSDVGKAVLINCVDFSGSSRPLGLGNGEISVTNTYYCLDNKTPASEGPWSGSNGGRMCYELISDTGVTIGTGLETTYSLSGITAGLQGVTFHGTLLLGEGETVTLLLTGDAPEGSVLTGFAASAGTLEHESDLYWTLTMPAENVTISAVLCPAFGTPTFTLPAALTTIEESAFESMTAMTVVDASHCTSIGMWAFRGCTGLTQIRLPADCAIDESAFDGCGTVYVFAPAGGATEDFCRSNDNPCVFVEEAQN